MGFISYFAIPMNIAILLFTRFPTKSPGVVQDLDDLLPKEESVLVRYMSERDPNYWTRSNIILFAILIEHLVIALKVVIALIIPDVPFSVTEDEFRRSQVREQVQRELRDMKNQNGLEDFNDMTTRLQK